MLRLLCFYGISMPGGIVEAEPPEFQPGLAEQVQLRQGRQTGRNALPLLSREEEAASQPPEKLIASVKNSSGTGGLDTDFVLAAADPESVKAEGLWRGFQYHRQSLRPQRQEPLQTVRQFPGGKSSHLLFPLRLRPYFHSECSHRVHHTFQILDLEGSALALRSASFHDAPRNSAKPNSEMRRWRRIVDASLWNPIFIKGGKGGQVCTDFQPSATQTA